MFRKDRIRMPEPATREQEKELQALCGTEVPYYGCRKTFHGRVDKTTFFSAPEQVTDTIGCYEDGNGSWVVFITDSRQGVEILWHRCQTERKAVRYLLDLVKTHKRCYGPSAG